jgi:uncharacterized protein (TIGR03435 family)
MTINNLVTYAYDVEPFQVTGPEWAGHDRFDIEANFPEGAERKDDRRMLQTLLKDRFKLAVHLEKRDLEGYVLVVGKHGEKLKPSLPDRGNPVTESPSQSGDTSVGGEVAKPKITRNKDGSSTVDLGERGIQTVSFDQERGAMHYDVSKISMEDLAARLRNCLGKGVHKVIDETGIKGTYHLAWDCPFPTLPSSGTNSADVLPSDPQDSSSLTRSLDALGLKLDKRKFLQDVYVIDHVEQPSAN